MLAGVVAARPVAATAEFVARAGGADIASHTVGRLRTVGASLRGPRGATGGDGRAARQLREARRRGARTAYASLVVAHARGARRRAVRRRRGCATAVEVDGDHLRAPVGGQVPSCGGAGGAARGAQEQGRPYRCQAFHGQFSVAHHLCTRSRRTRKRVRSSASSSRRSATTTSSLNGPLRRLRAASME